MNDAEQMESNCNANAKQSLPYIPFFYGDFLAKTTHLDGLEKSAYMLCIMHLWQYEYASAMQLQRICKANFGQWRDGNEIWEGIREFFKVNDEGMYYLSRVMRDREKVKQLSEKRRLAAISSHEKRAKKADASAEQLQSKSRANAMHLNSNKNIINPPTPLGGESSEYPTKDEFLSYCKVQGDHYGLTDEEWISIYNDFSFSGWTTLDSLGQTTRIGNWKVLSNKKAKTMSDKKRQQRVSTQINGKIPRAIEA